MKNAFSLLELIFVILIISIIASLAVPKFLDTRATAQTSTIKRDISTAISSIQSYYLINGKIDNISEAISLNNSVWEIETKKAVFKDSENECIVLEIKAESKQIDLSINENAGTLCQKISNEGISSSTYKLY